MASSFGIRVCDNTSSKSTPMSDRKLMPWKRGIFLTGMVFCFTLLGIAKKSAGQSTYIPLKNYSYPVLTRLQIINGEYSPDFDNTIKPIPNKAAVKFINRIDSLSQSTIDYSSRADRQGPALSAVDRYNIQKILGDNVEWTKNHSGAIPSKQPLFGTFYEDQANFYKVDVPDFFLAVNPLLYMQGGKSGKNNGLDYINSRGVAARGLLADKIGFYVEITSNDQKPPLFVQQRINEFRAVPGYGFYSRSDNNVYDYFSAAGYVTFDVTKYINVQFGQDKNFIGEGYRSLFLSDNAANYLFLKLNTHVWKLDYTNLYAKLNAPRTARPDGAPYNNKFMALHRLGVNITPWLNVGVFENILFGRKNYFDISYLNPIIFYRSVERDLGSPDNANVGFDAKAIVAHRIELYSQFLLDELKKPEFFSTRGWWGNKWALQVGGKYVNAFGVDNLDLQGELNVIRPYTYSHGDSLSNYSHYNQSMAHPNGANLLEGIFLAHYQPIPRLQLDLRIIASKQGRDTRDSDWGSNILIPYDNREQEYGNKIGQGLRDNVNNSSFSASYELRHNFYIGMTYLNRMDHGKWAEYYNLQGQNNNLFYINFRWNMSGIDYDF